MEQASARDSAVVSFVGAIVPDFVTDLLANSYHYAIEHPVHSLIGIAFFVLMFFLKGRFENSSNATARNAWKSFRDAFPLNPGTEGEADNPLARGKRSEAPVSPPSS